MLRHTILIVDDEPDIQMLLRLFFERQGHIIHRARDGQEAVDIAQKVKPDIILMDIQMPRKTGVEAVHELRADGRFATTPIVALTAYARKYPPAEVMRAGFDRVLFKPFDFGELQATMDDLLQ